MLAMALTTPAVSPTTPMTRRPLSRYKGKQIDDTDLLGAIDQVGLKLSKTFTLVDSMQNQSTRRASADRDRSTQPTLAIQPEWLNIDLMITATLGGRIVRNQTSSHI
jgi:hypothetical protein